MTKNPEPYLTKLPMDGLCPQKHLSKNLNLSYREYFRGQKRLENGIFFNFFLSL